MKSINASPFIWVVSSRALILVKTLLGNYEQTEQFSCFYLVATFDLIGLLGPSFIIF